MPDDRQYPQTLTALNAWMVESTRRCHAKGFSDGPIPRMVDQHGLRKAMELCVTKYDSDMALMRKLKAAGLLNETLEAGILYFHTLFGQPAVDAAKFRYDLVKRGVRL
jgi:hypothetical protein